VNNKSIILLEENSLISSIEKCQMTNEISKSDLNKLTKCNSKSSKESLKSNKNKKTCHSSNSYLKRLVSEELSKLNDKLDKNKNCKCDQDDYIHESIEDKHENQEYSNVNKLDSLTESNNIGARCLNSCCFNIIEYWKMLNNEEFLTAAKSNKKLDKLKSISGFDFGQPSITAEEIKDYYDNRSVYLKNRMQRRVVLANRFEELKTKSNFKIKPRYLDDNPSLAIIEDQSTVRLI
jgi:hypothetical protein